MARREGRFLGLEKAPCPPPPPPPPPSSSTSISSLQDPCRSSSGGSGGSTSSLMMMMMGEEEEDYSAVPDAMDLIHLDQPSNTTHQRAFQYQPYINPSQDRVVFLEKRGSDPLGSLPPISASIPSAAPPSSRKQLESACDYFHRLQREHAQKGTSSWKSQPQPQQIPSHFWTPPESNANSQVNKQSIDLGAVVESTIVETGAQHPQTPVQEEKSILAPISKVFTQHWIDIGSDLNVLLLDFDAAFTLLIPNVERGKPFKTNTTTVEVQTRLTSKGQKLTFMKFNFLNPESKIVAPVLDDKALGYKLLKKRSACVFLGRTLDDIKSAPPRRISPLPQTEMVSHSPPVSTRPHAMVMPCQTQSMALPQMIVPNSLPKSDIAPVSSSNSFNKSNDIQAFTTSSLPNSSKVESKVSKGSLISSLASNSVKTNDSQENCTTTTQVQPNPVPQSERVYPKNLISIYPALKEKELQKIVECRYCNKRFSFLSEHLIHLKCHTHDVDKVVEMSIQVWVSDRKLKCDKCKKKKTYTLDYAKHKDSHEIYGLSCNLCEASIPIPADFGPHMEKFHPTEILGDKGEKLAPTSNEMIPLVPNLSTPPLSSERDVHSRNDSNKLTFAPIAVKSSPFAPQEFVAKKSTPASFMSKKHIVSHPNVVSMGPITNHTSVSFNSTSPTKTSLHSLINNRNSSPNASQVPLLHENNSSFTESTTMNTSQSSTKVILQLSNTHSSSPLVQKNKALELDQPPGSMYTSQSIANNLKSPTTFSSSESQNLGIISSVYSEEKEESSTMCLQSPAPVQSQPPRECLPIPAQNTSLITNTLSETSQSMRKHSSSISIESQSQQWRNEDTNVIQSLFDDTESLSKNDSDKVGLSLSSVDSGVSDVNSVSPSIPNFERNVPLLNENKSIRDSLDSKPDEEFISVLDMYGLESQSRKISSDLNMSNSGSDLVNRHNILTDEPMLEELPSKVMQLDELCNTIDVSMEDVPPVNRKSWKVDSDNSYEEKLKSPDFTSIEPDSRLFDFDSDTKFESNQYEPIDKKTEIMEEEKSQSSYENDIVPNLSVSHNFGPEVIHDSIFSDSEEKKEDSIDIYPLDDINIIDQSSEVITTLDNSSSACLDTVNIRSEEIKMKCETNVPLKTDDVLSNSSLKFSEESDDELGTQSPCAIYKCEKCGDEFVTSNSLNIHKISCIIVNKCSLCNNRFMSLNSLKMHTSMCKKKLESTKNDVEKESPLNTKSSQSIEEKKVKKIASKELRMEKWNDENKNYVKAKPTLTKEKTHTKRRKYLRKPKEEAVENLKLIEKKTEEVDDFNHLEKHFLPKSDFRKTARKSLKGKTKSFKKNCVIPKPITDIQDPKPSLKINFGQILKRKGLQNQSKIKISKKKDKFKYDTSNEEHVHTFSLNEDFELSDYQDKNISSKVQCETAESLKIKPVERPSLKMKFGLSNINNKFSKKYCIQKDSNKNKRSLQEESKNSDYPLIKRRKKQTIYTPVEKHFGSTIRTDSDGHIKLRFTLCSKSKENCNSNLKRETNNEIEAEIRRVKPLKLKLNKKVKHLDKKPAHVNPLKIKLPLEKKETEQTEEINERDASLKIPKLVIKKDLIQCGSGHLRKVFIKKSNTSVRNQRKRIRNPLFQGLESLSCFVRLENVNAYKYDEEKCKKFEGFVLKLNERDSNSLNLKSLCSESPPLVPPLRLKLNSKPHTTKNSNVSQGTGKSLSDILCNLSGSLIPVLNRRSITKKSHLTSRNIVDSENSFLEPTNSLSSSLNLLLSPESSNDIVSKIISDHILPYSITHYPGGWWFREIKDSISISPKKKSPSLVLTSSDGRSNKSRRKKKKQSSDGENIKNVSGSIEKTVTSIQCEEENTRKVPCLKISKKLLRDHKINSEIVPPIKLKTNLFFAKKSLPKSMCEDNRVMDFYNYDENQSCEETNLKFGLKLQHNVDLPSHIVEDLQDNHSYDVSVGQGKLESNDDADSLKQISELDTSSGETSIKRELTPCREVVCSDDTSMPEISQQMLSQNDTTLHSSNTTNLIPRFPKIHQEQLRNSSFLEDTLVGEKDTKVLSKTLKLESLSSDHLGGVVQDEFLSRLNLLKSTNLIKKCHLPKNIDTTRAREIFSAPSSTKDTKCEAENMVSDHIVFNKSDTLCVINPILDDILSTSISNALFFTKSLDESRYLTLHQTQVNKMIPYQMCTNGSMNYFKKKRRGPDKNLARFMPVRLSRKNELLCFKGTPKKLRHRRRQLLISHSLDNYQKICDTEIKDDNILASSLRIPNSEHSMHTKLELSAPLKKIRPIEIRSIDFKRKISCSLLEMDSKSLTTDYANYIVPKKARIIPSIKRKGLDIAIHTEPKKPCFSLKRYSHYDKLILKYGRIENKLKINNNLSSILTDVCKPVQLSKTKACNMSILFRLSETNFNVNQFTYSGINVQKFSASSGLANDFITNISVDSLIKPDNWLLGFKKKLSSNTWEQLTIDFSKFIHSANAVSGAAIVKASRSYFNLMVDLLRAFILRGCRKIVFRIKQVLYTLVTKGTLALTYESKPLDAEILYSLPHNLIHIKRKSIYLDQNVGLSMLHHQSLFLNMFRESSPPHFHLPSLISDTFKRDKSEIVESIVHDALYDAMNMSDFSNLAKLDNIEVANSIMQEIIFGICCSSAQNSTSLTHNVGIIECTSIEGNNVNISSKEFMNSMDIVHPLIQKICDDIVENVELPQDSSNSSTGIVHQKLDMKPLCDKTTTNSQYIVEPIIHNIIENLFVSR